MIKRYDIDSESLGDRNALIASDDGDFIFYSDYIADRQELVDLLRRCEPIVHSSLTWDTKQLLQRIRETIDD